MFPSREESEMSGFTAYPPIRVELRILKTTTGAKLMLPTQVVHHEETLKRRGRPFGPAPLGRGIATIEEFLQHLDREADEEAG